MYLTRQQLIDVSEFIYPLFTHILDHYGIDPSAFIYSENTAGAESVKEKPPYSVVFDIEDTPFMVREYGILQKDFLGCVKERRASFTVYSNSIDRSVLTLTIQIVPGSIEVFSNLAFPLQWVMRNVEEFGYHIIYTQGVIAHDSVQITRNDMSLLLRYVGKE